MAEQNINASGKSIYWVIAPVVIMVLAALIWFLTGGEREEASNKEGAEQVLRIPEQDAGTLDTALVKEGNLNFSDQLPLYAQDDWHFKRQGEDLPSLADSDAEFTRDLLSISPQLQHFLFKNERIKKTIFSINDMAQGLRPPAKRLREISFPQPFSVTGEEGKMYMSEQAYHRYDSLAQAVSAIDEQGAVALYKKYLPLFQIVFAEFSYPDDYQVLDSLKAVTAKVIQAPVIEGKIEVIRPSVRYKYADPKLEKLSALDKQMLRMGPDNTRMIQKKLRKLIEALIAAE